MKTVAKLEEQLKDNKTLMQRRDVIVRLGKNPDFRTVILDAFFVEECARYARESGDPALTAEQRADAIAMAQAAGHLKRFLNVQIAMGNAAEQSVVALEEAIEEARIEEQNDDNELPVEGEGE